MPTRGLRENEKAYAVAFGIPTDTKGLTLLHQLPTPDFRRLTSGAKGMDFGNERYGVYNLCEIFFDDVFVPWERVFLCGETEFAGKLALLFALYHRHSYTGCKAAVSEIYTGATALAAEYKGG